MTSEKFDLTLKYWNAYLCYLHVLYTDCTVVKFKHGFFNYFIL